MSVWRGTATATAWGALTVLSVASWFTWFSVVLVAIPCFAFLMLDALTSREALRDRRGPVQASPAVTRALRVALAITVAIAACAIYASTASSDTYHGESHEISRTVAPILWIWIAVLAARAASTISPRRVASLALVAVLVWPILVVLCSLSDSLALDTVPSAGYEIPRWAAATFTIAIATVVGSSVILRSICLAGAPATDATSDGADQKPGL